MPFDLNQPDSRLIGGGGGGGGTGGAGNFVGTLGQLMTFKTTQLQQKQLEQENELKKRDLQDDDDMTAALQSHARPDDAVQSLWDKGNSGAAYKLAHQVYQGRKEQSDLTDAQIKQVGTRLEGAMQIAQGINDDASLNSARPALISMLQPVYGDAIKDRIPTTYGDGSVMRSLMAAGTSRALELQNQHQLILDGQDAWFKGMQKDPKTGMWSPNGLAAQESYHNSLARHLSTAQNETQWNYLLDLAHANGAPSNVTDAFGKWSADAPTRAFRLGLSIPQEATFDNAARGRETAEDREARLAREAGGGGKGRGASGLTVAEEDKVTADRDAANKATETWLQKTWGDEKGGAGGMAHRAVPGSPGITVPYLGTLGATAGKPAVPAPVLRVQDLSEGAQNEFVRQKTQNENNFRNRMHMPTIEEAAKIASQTGDQVGYDKLDQEYTSLTQGLRSLASIAPNPGARSISGAVGPGSGAMMNRMSGSPTSQPATSRPGASPAEVAQFNLRQQAKALSDAVEAEPDPTRKATLLKQLYDLVNGTPTSGGR